MQHESNVIKELVVTDSTLGFQEVYLKPYTPQDYINDIKKADILILPNENFRDMEGYFFSEYTEEVLNYLRDNFENELLVDICTSDEKYQKLELHADVINLPLLIVQWMILPTLTSMIASYLYDKIKKNNKSPKDVNANVEIIVEKQGKSKKVSYKGSIENFESAMKTIDEGVFK